jgi:RNA polymerase sigma factor (sigma-70 family)
VRNKGTKFQLSPSSQAGLLPPSLDLSSSAAFGRAISKLRLNWSSVIVPFVKSIIRREVGDTALTDDLYQESFCIILEKVRRGDVREAEKLSGFVCGVARNQVVKHFQRAARQRNLAETEDAASISNSASDQLEQLLQREKADIIRQILKEMTNERDIQALFRSYLAEHDKKQICVIIWTCAYKKILPRENFGRMTLHYLWG